MLPVKAPNPWPADKYTVFLAGSIEQGAADDWQETVTAALYGYDVTLLNPRRDNWDKNLPNSKDNAVFREQVEWELRGLDAADLVLMYFQPGTQSPITLLELGLVAGRTRTLVCCPEGFWRKGNVDVVCDFFGITQVPTLSDLISFTKSRIPSRKHK